MTRKVARANTASTPARLASTVLVGISPPESRPRVPIVPRSTGFHRRCCVTVRPEPAAASTSREGKCGGPAALSLRGDYDALLLGVIVEHLGAVLFAIAAVLGA